MASSGVSLPHMVTKEENSGGNTANEECFISSSSFTLPVNNYDHKNGTSEVNSYERKKHSGVSTKMEKKERRRLSIDAPTIATRKSRIPRYGMHEKLGERTPAKGEKGCNDGDDNLEQSPSKVNVISNTTPVRSNCTKGEPNLPKKQSMATTSSPISPAGMKRVVSSGSIKGRDGTLQTFTYSPPSPRQRRRISSFARLEQTHMNNPRIGKSPMSTGMKRINSSVDLRTTSSRQHEFTRSASRTVRRVASSASLSRIAEAYEDDPMESRLILKRQRGTDDDAFASFHRDYEKEAASPSYVYDVSKNTSVAVSAAYSSDADDLSIASSGTGQSDFGFFCSTTTTTGQQQQQHQQPTQRSSFKLILENIDLLSSQDPISIVGRLDTFGKGAQMQRRQSNGAARAAAAAARADDDHDDSHSISSSTYEVLMNKSEAISAAAGGGGYNVHTINYDDDVSAFGSDGHSLRPMIVLAGVESPPGSSSSSLASDVRTLTSTTSKSTTHNKSTNQALDVTDKSPSVSSFTAPPNCLPTADEHRSIDCKMKIDDDQNTTTTQSQQGTVSTIGTISKNPKFSNICHELDHILDELHDLAEHTDEEGAEKDKDDSDPGSHSPLLMDDDDSWVFSLGNHTDSIDTDEEASPSKEEKKSLLGNSNQEVYPPSSTQPSSTETSITVTVTDEASSARKVEQQSDSLPSEDLFDDSSVDTKDTTSEQTGSTESPPPYLELFDDSTVDTTKKTSSEEAGSSEISAPFDTESDEQKKATKVIVPPDKGKNDTRNDTETEQIEQDDGSIRITSSPCRNNSLFDFITKKTPEEETGSSEISAPSDTESDEQDKSTTVVVPLNDTKTEQVEQEDCSICITSSPPKAAPLPQQADDRATKVITPLDDGESDKLDKTRTELVGQDDSRCARCALLKDVSTDVRPANDKVTVSAPAQEKTEISKDTLLAEKLRCQHFIRNASLVSTQYSSSTLGSSPLFVARKNLLTFPAPVKKKRAMDVASSTSTSSTSFMQDESVFTDEEDEQESFDKMIEVAADKMRAMLVLAVYVSWTLHSCYSLSSSHALHSETIGIGNATSSSVRQPSVIDLRRQQWMMRKNICSVVCVAGLCYLSTVQSKKKPMYTQEQVRRRQLRQASDSESKALVQMMLHNRKSSLLLSYVMVGSYLWEGLFFVLSITFE